MKPTVASAAPDLEAEPESANAAAARAQPPASHFQQLGGSEAVAGLVEAFYLQMDTLPQARVIRAMHPADLEPVKEVLKRYFTEWLGGPPLYSEERGHPRLRRRHMPFSIGAAERDAWMLCMTRALDSVSDDATLKHTLTQAFFRTADFIRTH